MSDEPERPTIPADLALTALFTLIGGWLRFQSLGQPALWLDELLNHDITTQSLSLPWYAWLLGFERENGPLYYAALLAGRIVPDVELSARLASAVGGTLTIPLLALILRPLSNGRYLSVFAAALIATSPFHVYYSKEGRPYALLVLDVVLILGALLHPGNRIAKVGGVAGCFAAAFTSATAGPLLAATLCSAAALVMARRERARSLRVLGISALAGIGVLALHYGRFEQPPTPPQGFGLEIIGRLMNVFSSTGLEWTGRQWLAWLFLAMAIHGGVSLYRLDKRLLLVAGTFLFTGLVSAIAGLLLVQHWFSARYVIFTLPAYLILVAAGATGTLPATRGRARAALATALALLLTVPNLHEARTEAGWKVDWRKAIAAIRSVPDPPSRVITSNTWTAVCLEFYARQTEAPLDIQNANESIPTARQLLGRERRVALIAAGWHADDSIREWMRTGCEIWSSDIETARVYLYPDCP